MPVCRDQSLILPVTGDLALADAFTSAADALTQMLLPSDTLTNPQISSYICWHYPIEIYEGF